MRSCAEWRPWEVAPGHKVEWVEEKENDPSNE